MATATGRSEVSAYIGALPVQLGRLLRGAARAGGRVIADEAKTRSPSPVVADAIVLRSKAADDRVVVTVTVKRGWAYSLALWGEYGTSPHFISVDDNQRSGLGLGRINQRVRDADGNGSLVIGGKFVGSTVFHPGARPNPFLRPSLDTKEGEAVQTAQAYINARISGGKIDTLGEKEG